MWGVISNFGSVGWLVLGTSRETGNRLNALTGLRFSLHLVAFKVGALNHLGQQAALTEILETFKIGLPRLSGTRTHDSIPIIAL